MIAGNPDTSFAVRWELIASFYVLLVLAVVCWSVYHTVLKRAAPPSRAARRAPRTANTAARAPKKRNAQ